jgi:cobalt-zinc-cadmium efflux system membrane fusion protein
MRILNKEFAIGNRQWGIGKKKPFFAYCLLLIVVCFLFTACNNKQTSEEQVNTATQEPVAKLTEAQYKNAAIEIGKTETKNVFSVLKLNGKIDVPPQNMVTVSVPLGGYLKSTKLLSGMHINKGEVIAVMEDPQYIQLQQDYLTAKAQFAYNESEYFRQKELNESKAVSDKIFEQAKATYQTQNILIKSLEQKLRLIGLHPNNITANTITKSISIHSPINGFVSAVNVNIGKYVMPSDVMFELVNPNDIHLTLTVFDKDVNKLAIGQKVFASSNSNPDKKYECEIVFISKSLSNDNATQVHCRFLQYDKTLLPGMFMNATIELSGGNVTVLPNDAIVHFENKSYVFVEKGSRQFEMLEVQIGNAENGFTEIIDAEKLANKNIAVKGAYNLLMVLKNTDEE